MRRWIGASLLCVVVPLALRAETSPKKPLLVDLEFVPQGTDANSLALPPSMIDQAVDITVDDARGATEARALGQGTDSDDRYFPIEASVDVVQFTRDAVARMADEQALERNTAAPRKLELRLTRFTVNESNKAVGSTYAAEVHLTYTLKDAEGRALTECASSGVANRYGRKRSGANCAEVLSDALKAAFLETLGDDPLQAAWTSGQPSSGLAGAAPAADAGQAPAGASVEERLEQLDDLLKKGLITEAEHRTKRAEILEDL